MLVADDVLGRWRRRRQARLALADKVVSAAAAPWAAAGGAAQSGDFVARKPTGATLAGAGPAEDGGGSRIVGAADHIGYPGHCFYSGWGMVLEAMIELWLGAYKRLYYGVLEVVG